MVFILNATLILGSSELTPLTLCRIKEGKIISLKERKISRSVILPEDN